MTDDRAIWLDSWCNTRRLSQQDLARSWASVEATKPKYRPLRPGEPIPHEFDDPDQQAAFEAYARKYRWVLRVPF